MPARRKKKDAYHHGDLKRAVLDEAVALVGEQGTRSLTLREVARRLGVTPAAPYRHFADKEALLAAVAEEGYRMLAEQMSAATRAAGTDPRVRLAALGAAYLRFALLRPAHYAVTFGADRPPMESHPEMHDAATAANEVVAAEFVGLQQRGLVARGDVLDQTMFLWSMLHGLALLLPIGQLPPGWNVTAGSRALPELVERVVGVVVRGLAPRAGRK
jgi:AcrR family transcriptional regulator